MLWYPGESWNTVVIKFFVDSWTFIFSFCQLQCMLPDHEIKFGFGETWSTLYSTSVTLGNGLTGWPFVMKSLSNTPFASQNTVTTNFFADCSSKLWAVHNNGCLNVMESMYLLIWCIQVISFMTICAWKSPRIRSAMPFQKLKRNVNALIHLSFS